MTTLLAAALCVAVPATVLGLIAAVSDHFDQRPQR